MGRIGRMLDKALASSDVTTKESDAIEASVIFASENPKGLEKMFDREVVDGLKELVEKEKE